MYQKTLFIDQLMSLIRAKESPIPRPGGGKTSQAPKKLYV
jgi:hypothetical protein